MRKLPRQVDSSKVEFSKLRLEQGAACRHHLAIGAEALEFGHKCVEFFSEGEFIDAGYEPFWPCPVVGRVKRALRPRPPSWPRVSPSVPPGAVETSSLYSASFSGLRIPPDCPMPGQLQGRVTCCKSIYQSNYVLHFRRENRTREAHRPDTRHNHPRFSACQATQSPSCLRASSAVQNAPAHFSPPLNRFVVPAASNSPCCMTSRYWRPTLGNSWACGITALQTLQTDSNAISSQMTS